VYRMDDLDMSLQFLENILAKTTPLSKDVQSKKRAALEWCQSGALVGHARSQTVLAFCFFKKHIINEQEDFDACAFWAHKAADIGDSVNACALLSELYFKGNGVMQSDEKALYYCAKAAQRGHMISQCNLGFTCEHGCEGVVEKNEPLAIYWYSQSARKGYTKALQYLLNLLNKQTLKRVQELRETELLLQCEEVEPCEKQQDQMMSVDLTYEEKPSSSLDCLRCEEHEHEQATTNIYSEVDSWFK